MMPLNRNLLFNHPEQIIGVLHYGLPTDDVKLRLVPYHYKGNISGSYFFYTWFLTSAILLFLCFGADFSVISLTEYIAVAAMPLRILHLFCIRVWDYPNKLNGHGPAGAGFGRFSGVWPHSLWMSF